MERRGQAGRSDLAFLFRRLRTLQGTNRQGSMRIEGKTRSGFGRGRALRRIPAERTPIVTGVESRSVQRVWFKVVAFGSWGSRCRQGSRWTNPQLDSEARGHTKRRTPPAVALGVHLARSSSVPVKLVGEKWDCAPFLIFNFGGRGATFGPLFSASALGWRRSRRGAWGPGFGRKERGTPRHDVDGLLTVAVCAVHGWKTGGFGGKRPKCQAGWPALSRWSGGGVGASILAGWLIGLDAEGGVGRF